MASWRAFYLFLTFEARFARYARFARSASVFGWFYLFLTFEARFARYARSASVFGWFPSRACQRSDDSCVIIFPQCRYNIEVPNQKV